MKNCQSSVARCPLPSHNKAHFGLHREVRMNNQSNAIAIVGGTIIDGNGGAPIDGGVILIDGQRIVAVGDRSTQIPSGAKQLSAAGKFIIPGLMDAYVYLVDGVTPSNVTADRARNRHRGAARFPCVL